MVPAWLAAFFGIMLSVLGMAVGILGAHYSLGNKITQALTELKDVTRRVTLIESATVHTHRRKEDAGD